MGRAVTSAQARRSPKDDMAKQIEYNSAGRALRVLADPRRAAVSSGYFKDSRGDIFLGVSTPLLRKLAKDFRAMPLPHLRWLCGSTPPYPCEQRRGGGIIGRRYW